MWRLSWKFMSMSHVWVAFIQFLKTSPNLNVYFASLRLKYGLHRLTQGLDSGKTFLWNRPLLSNYNWLQLCSAGRCLTLNVLRCEIAFYIVYFPLNKWKLVTIHTYNLARWKVAQQQLGWSHMMATQFGCQESWLRLSAPLLIKTAALLKSKPKLVLSTDSMVLVGRFTE